MVLLIGLIFVFAGSAILRKFWDEENKKKAMTVWMAVKLGFSIMAVIIGATFIWTETETILDGSYNAAAKAYHNGEYAVMEGVAEDVNWTMGGYSFRIDDTVFFCEQTLQGRQRNDVTEHLGAEKTIQVYYYDGVYFDESQKQYEVVRIDVLDAAE